jgi:hydrogenase expression/formation protein HypC
MRIVEMEGPEATVELSGVRKRVRMDLVRDVSVGDYALVHAGYAITVIPEEEARETLEYLREMADGL